MGDRFIVSLGSTFCAPRKPITGTTRQLLIRHTGNGNDSCAYQ
jgi:hypothetical protein